MAVCGLIVVALAVAIDLIVLHRSDGGEVTVNAEQITSLRTPGAVAHARCLVGLTDGRFVGVLETCTEVRQRLAR